MKVTIVHCTQQTDHRVELDVPKGTTIGAAIELSGVYARAPSLQAGCLTVGIWNRVVGLEQVLNEGDRIEIYRPLSVDPKEGRRLRAELKRTRAKSARSA